ncbi:MAG TPA: hypothetical protein PK916_00520 [Bacteroidota bacterium]|nr:hypothetical protein [Bacteroidota bacterium]
MRRFSVALFSMLLQSITALAQPVVVTVTDSVLLEHTQRFGINVGSRSWWGADQFRSNLIDNPGFEAGEFASLVLVDQGASGRSVPMAFWDPAWNNEQYGIGWPVDFWNGARYEFLWGNARGRSGTVRTFRHEGGRNVFDMDDDGAVPERLSVLRLHRTVAGLQGNAAIVDATAVRPGSPGKQSLRLTYDGASYRFYMDSLWRDGDRSAGKLLIIRGEYLLRLWVKARRAGDVLRVRFFREGEGQFFNEAIAAGENWQLVERRFEVPPGADPQREYSEQEYHPILAFAMDVETPGGEVLVDDIELRAVENEHPSGFTNNYIDRLRELRPGVLRYWGGQLGAGLATQLAAPFERGTNGYAPRDRRPGEFCYSLHEFLLLCEEVGADPWYVIPPTFSPEELRGLVEYLAAPAIPAHPWAMRRADLGRERPWTEAFGRMHLEYGNEMWGSGAGDDPFMGSSVNGGERLASIAHDRFSIMRAAAGFDASRMMLVIGGQAGYAGRQREIEQHGSAHDAVALAPYFGVLDTWSNESEIFRPLLASPFYQASGGAMRESRGYVQRPELSIYEINFHTTHGSSPIDIRNDFLTGAAGALALPLHMLVYLRDLAVRTQCAFSSLGYSFRLPSGEMARLWGMLRDLEATGRKRPTWLGVELANAGVGGDMLHSSHSATQPRWQQTAINGIGASTEVHEVQSFAFRRGDTLSVLLFNLSLGNAHSVRLNPPRTPSSLAAHYAIIPSSIHDDNEDAVNVRIDTLAAVAHGVEVTLPPHSLHVLRWTDRASTGTEPLPTPHALSLRAEVAGHDGYLLHYEAHAPARLEVFDVLGSLREVLFDGHAPRAATALHWRPQLPSGVYVLRLSTSQEQRTLVLPVLRGAAAR